MQLFCVGCQQSERGLLGKRAGQAVLILRNHTVTRPLGIRRRTQSKWIGARGNVPVR